MAPGMNFLAKPLAAALLLSLLACPALARTLTGVVSHVTDGDTLWVRPAGGGAPVPVRLHGIDAPEICQAYGVEARRALASRVRRHRVQVVIRASDAYQRHVARVELRGQDIGAWMVAGGHAWSSRHRDRPGPYAQEEAQARAARLGLWAARAVEPRLFRRSHGPCDPGR